MYDRILLPTDGSRAMGSTIEQCLHQARQNDATIHVLYVIDVRSFMMLPEETGEKIAQLLEEDGRQAIETIAEQADDADLSVVTDLRVGVPHDAILTYADEHDIDLIVMGTHGRTGDEQRTLGSVAEAVVRAATVPVLTVRMSEVERQAVEDAIPAEQQRYIR